MSDPESPDALARDLRTDWHRYVDALVPLRPDLFAYCRGLTGSVWDAEDLVQDTLVRAFARWGVSYPWLRNPRSYLLRTATHTWIDQQRRQITEQRLPEGALPVPASAAPADAASEARDAGARLLQRLSPQERAAFVLREVFDMTLQEIAETLATTLGAVKAALHRGRGRLAESEDGGASRRPHASPELVDRFVACLRAADLDGLLCLMLDSASAENVGNSFHTGADPEHGFPRVLQAMVCGHREWPAAFRAESQRVERVVFEGEWLVATFVSRGGREALMSVARLDEQDGRVARLRSYGFCPDTIRAIADELEVPAWTGLYRAPTPAPGEDWPEPQRA
jgi:RNA polymerase sigma-70 factor (ECF subfamily)